MTEFLSEEKNPNETKPSKIPTKGSLGLLLNGERKVLADDAKKVEVFDVFLLHFSKEVNCIQVANPMNASNKEVMSGPKRKRMLENTSIS